MERAVSLNAKRKKAIVRNQGLTIDEEKQFKNALTPPHRSPSHTL
jgi:hypothetical protein